MIKHSLAALMLAAAALAAVPSWAAKDPSSQQIYQAARAGNLGRAQAMIDRVLKDHPQSGKAHYVAAELAVREGRLATARTELLRAETLAPGLPFAQPRSVHALRARLDQPTVAVRTGELAPRRHLPWGGVLLLGAIALIVLSLLRRRTPNPAYGRIISPVGPFGVATPGGPFAGPYGGPGTYGPGPYGAASPPTGGIGSGIVGGLASGLGIGAGMVAGEELAQHLVNGGQSVAPGGSGSDDGDPLGNPGLSTADLGGNDFGITDDRGSWDDGGGADGGDGWN